MNSASYMAMLDDLYERQARRSPPWFTFVLPGEEPKRFRGRRKWRKQQERIFWLERRLEVIDTGWDYYTVFPWAKYDFGY